MQDILAGQTRFLGAVAAALLWLVAASPAAADPPVLSVTLTGQSAIHADLRVQTPAAFQAIAPLLKGDVIFTNFEAAVAEGKGPIAAFQAPPEALDALMSAGFNLMALSNNHSWDLGQAGLENTLRAVTLRNLAHAGIGETAAEATAPAFLHTPKGTVALVSMASGLIPPGAAATADHAGVNELRVDADGKPNPQDAQRILDAIRAAAKGADLVIAYQHNHVFEKDFSLIFNEELPERLVPPPWIKSWAHQEIDAGADIVVLHGAPLLHGVEIYRGRPIFYDMGNFIFQAPPTATMLEEPIIWEGAVAHVEFQGKQLKSISFQPIAMNKLGRGYDDQYVATRGLPAPVSGEKAGYILRRLADASRPFGSEFEIRGDSATIRLRPTR